MKGFFLVFLLCGCLCADPIYQDDLPSSTSTSITISSPQTSTTTTLKEGIKIIYINQTRYINQTINIVNITEKEEFYNFSLIQKNLLLNLKPDRCHTIACSEGFFKAKDEMMDIMDFKKSRYSEKPSIGYDPFFYEKKNDSIISFNLLDDGFGNYFILNQSFWRINHPMNKTLFENLDFSMIENESMHDFSLNNISLFDRETVIVRRI